MAFEGELPSGGARGAGEKAAEFWSLQVIQGDLYQPAQATMSQHELFCSAITNHCYALSALNTMDQL